MLYIEKFLKALTEGPFCRDGIFYMLPVFGKN